MSLLQKLISNSTIKETSSLGSSKMFEDIVQIPTQVPAVNVAMSGKLNGGFTGGLTIFAGPSKHFKTSFALLLAKAYLDKYKDSIILFYDSEFGAPAQYFANFGIDINTQVVHTPIKDIEELKLDLVKQLSGLTKTDKVIIVVDSVGNLASKKEADDAAEGKSVGDMSRAKAMKSLFRIVTPHIKMKDIPFIVINHTYKEIGLYPKDIVSGGTGIYYSADNIYIIGRQQEKEGTQVVGYNFIINVEKSRFVKEKSKIAIEFNSECGISQWSGLLDMALESGHVTKPSNGWYVRGTEEKKYREDGTNTREFWEPILLDVTFQDFVKNKYSLNSKVMSYDQGDPNEED